MSSASRANDSLARDIAELLNAAGYGDRAASAW
jgi:hypothetical protein